MKWLRAIVYVDGDPDENEDAYYESPIDRWEDYSLEKKLHTVVQVDFVEIVSSNYPSTEEVDLSTDIDWQSKKQ
jgi:hypothetical protein